MRKRGITKYNELTVKKARMSVADQIDATRRMTLAPGKEGQTLVFGDVTCREWLGKRRSVGKDRRTGTGREPDKRKGGCVGAWACKGMI